MFEQSHLEHALTEKEMVLRDFFVSEYLKDFDAYNACLRLGFQATYAVSWSQTLLGCGYVQRKLSYLQGEPEGPEQDKLDKAMALRELRRVAQRGSDSARVAAIRQLAALRGWDQGSAEDSAPLVQEFQDLAWSLPS